MSDTALHTELRLSAASVRHAEENTAWILAHPAFSDWLKETLRSAMTCDPSQVANDLELLNHYCSVHRWRYSLPQAHGTTPAPSFWWDAAQGMGVCGDFLGGCGDEGAWLPAQAWSAALLQPASNVAGASTARADAEAAAAADQQVPRRFAA